MNMNAYNHSEQSMDLTCYGNNHFWVVEKVFRKKFNCTWCNRVRTEKTTNQIMSSKECRAKVDLEKSEGTSSVETYSIQFLNTRKPLIVSNVLLANTKGA